MKFAGKISEADVSNVTWSVPSFYANKSGERLISPWCSDAAAVTVVIVVDDDDNDDDGDDGDDGFVNGGERYAPDVNPRDTLSPGLRFFELRKRYV